MDNSGRPMSDSDVEGRWRLGASSKVDAHGVQRASIGNKGLGLKSVPKVADAQLRVREFDQIAHLDLEPTSNPDANEARGDSL